MSGIFYGREATNPCCVDKRKGKGGRESWQKRGCNGGGNRRRGKMRCGENALLNLRNTTSVQFPDFLVSLRNLIVATEKKNFVVHRFHKASHSVHTVLLVQTISQSFPNENSLLSYRKRNHTSRKVSCLLPRQNQRTRTNTNWTSSAHQAFIKTRV